MRSDRAGLCRLGRGRPLAMLVGLVALSAACADDSADTAVTAGTAATTTETPTAPDRPTDSTTPPIVTEPADTTAIAPPATAGTSVAPTTTEPDVVLPTGIVFAVPTQNREDPAKGQFQVQVHNGTRDRFDIAGVQFAWTGYTTPMTERDSVVVGGQIIDFPVPFTGAACTGDGLAGTMPSLDGARVVLALDDGSTLEIPVVDQWHLARKLYVDDCEKQMIESLVTIEWIDLHEEQFEGRPVTAGELRLTRRIGTGTITVLAISNTIPYEFAAVDTAVGEPVAILADGATDTSAPVRFLESRCDPHALAEVKQPTKFVAQVQLGDGSVHPYIVYPPREDWTAMRLIADEACVILGEVVFVGDD